MNRYRACIIAMLMVSLCTLRVAAQEEEQEPVKDLKTVSLGFSMDNISASGLELRAGLDLEEFIALGVLWDMGFSSEGGEPATELGVGIWTEAVLLSENNDLPISFIVSGEFMKTRLLSSYLEDNELVKSGTGYLIGATLSRRFVLSEKAAIYAALNGWYRFDTYTLEAEAGSEISFETQITPVTDFFYGLQAAYELALSENMALAVGIQLHLNSEFHFFYGPEIKFITW